MLALACVMVKEQGASGICPRRSVPESNSSSSLKAVLPCLQLEAIEAESGGTPAFVTLPFASDQIPVLTAIIFTGTQFVTGPLLLNSSNRSNRSIANAATSSCRCEAVLRRERRTPSSQLGSRPRACKRPRCSGSDPVQGTIAEVHNVDVVTRDGTGMRHLTDILRGKVPRSLRHADIVSLVEACKSCMAIGIASAIPKYLRSLGLMRGDHAAKVRSTGRHQCLRYIEPMLANAVDQCTSSTSMTWLASTTLRRRR